MAVALGLLLVRRDRVVAALLGLAGLFAAQLAGVGVVARRRWPHWGGSTEFLTADELVKALATAIAQALMYSLPFGVALAASALLDRFAAVVVAGGVAASAVFATLGEGFVASGPRRAGMSLVILGAFVVTASRVIGKSSTSRNRREQAAPSDG